MRWTTGVSKDTSVVGPPTADGGKSSGLRMVLFGELIEALSVSSCTAARTDGGRANPYRNVADRTPTPSRRGMAHRAWLRGLGSAARLKA